MLAFTYTSACFTYAMAAMAYWNAHDIEWAMFNLQFGLIYSMGFCVYAHNWEKLGMSWRQKII